MLKTLTAIGLSSTLFMMGCSDTSTTSQNIPSTEVSPLPVVSMMPPLNDTGISYGGTVPVGNVNGCIGSSVSEQDCFTGRDADAVRGTLTKTGSGVLGFDFTRLNADGSENTGSLDYATNPWSCVKDNVTGLVWEVKANSEIRTDLHSHYDVYSWYDSNGSTNGGTAGVEDIGDYCTGYNAGDSSTYCNTEAFAKRVNVSGLCGYNDWRMPTVNELQTITHLGRVSASIDTTHFPNTVGDNFLTGQANYWTATPSVGWSSCYSWAANFYNGTIDDFGCGNKWYARVVRSS